MMSKTDQKKTGAARASNTVKHPNFLPGVEMILNLAGFSLMRKYYIECEFLEMPKR
jgi:hypothetical protein